MITSAGRISAVRFQPAIILFKVCNVEHALYIVKWLRSIYILFNNGAKNELLNNKFYKKTLVFGLWFVVCEFREPSGLRSGFERRVRQRANLSEGMHSFSLSKERNFWSIKLTIGKLTWSWRFQSLSYRMIVGEDSCQLLIDKARDFQFNDDLIIVVVVSMNWLDPFDLPDAGVV